MSAGTAIGPEASRQAPTTTAAMQSTNRPAAAPAILRLHRHMVTAHVPQRSWAVEPARGILVTCLATEIEPGARV